MSRGLPGINNVKRAYLFLTPAIIIFVVVIAYPIGSTLGTSIWQDGFTLELYKNVFEKQEFPGVLLQTAIWTFGGMIIIFLISFLIALSLNENFFGYKIARILLLLPWATPIAISALVWRWIFNDQYGILNYIINVIGITDARVPWLAKTVTGFAANMTVEIWSGLPLMTLILLSGLQAIPNEVYEAAIVDGANYWKSLWRITIPLMRPVFVVATLMFIIWTFNSFPVVYIITRGGPIHSTDTLITYIYKIAFQYGLFEEATALAAITFFLVLAVSVPYAQQYFRVEEKS
jgi:ABC-type sugar transport system permease subunit